MPEKDGSEDKKSTKSVVNKKQKQFMNQEEQLDLSSVAESFGGQIVGEPVELDEIVVTGTLGTAAAIKYGIPAAIAIGAGAYDYYKKRKGERGIFPDLSGTVKNVYDKARGVFRSKKTQIGDDTQSKRRKKIQKILNKSGDEQKKDLSDLLNVNQKNTNRRKTKINQNIDTSFGDALKKNRKINKKLNKPEIKGDPLKTGEGPSTNTNTNTNTNTSRSPNNKNNKNKIGNIIKGKTKAGATTRSSLLGGGIMTGLTTLTKGKGKGKGRGLGLPGTAHNVGRRTNPQ